LRFHIVVKCNYNNGQEGDYVGFSSICSDEQIKNHIEQRDSMCSQPFGQCSEYYKSDFRGIKPKSACMESVLFKDWQYDAGHFWSGKRAGKPKHLRKDPTGNLAIFTTIFPGDREIHRRIIGLFRIKKVVDEPEKPTTLIGDKKLGIRLLLRDSKQLYYWKYANTKGGARWGSGLIRYLNNDQAHAILEDLLKILDSDNHRNIVKKLLKEDFPGGEHSHPDGYLMPEEVVQFEDVHYQRKYGSGGEGSHHLELKRWVAAHPEEIGLPHESIAITEYKYICHDRADILFTLPDEKFAVVEIETNDPLPGYHQVLKYHTLTCAEKGFPLDSSRVKKILVAWFIPENVARFCEQYGIHCVEKKI